MKIKSVVGYVMAYLLEIMLELELKLKIKSMILTKTLKVFFNKSKAPLKELQIEDKVSFWDLLETVGFFKQGPI